MRILFDPYDSPHYDHVFWPVSPLILINVVVFRQKYLIFDEKDAFSCRGDHSFVK